MVGYSSINYTQKHPSYTSTKKLGRTVIQKSKHTNLVSYINDYSDLTPNGKILKDKPETKKKGRDKEKRTKKKILINLKTIR